MPWLRKARKQLWLARDPPPSPSRVDTSYSHSERSLLEKKDRSLGENNLHEWVLLYICVCYIQKKLKNTLKRRSETWSPFLQLTRSISLLLAEGSSLTCNFSFLVVLNIAACLVLPLVLIKFLCEPIQVTNLAENKPSKEVTSKGATGGIEVERSLSWVLCTC